MQGSRRGFEFECEACAHGGRFGFGLGLSGDGGGGAMNVTAVT
jgi:hypothetical protein